MNISPVNMNAQSFGNIFKKGDKPTSVFPDEIANNVGNHEVVCIIVNGGDDWYPYTAEQWRAQKAADSRIEQMKDRENAKAAYEATIKATPDYIKYLND